MRSLSNLSLLGSCATLLLGLSACSDSPSTNAPSIETFAASATTVAAGETVSITWAVKGATNIVITAEPGGELLNAATAAGMLTSEALTQNTVFTINASSAAGMATDTITVTIDGMGNQPMINSFTASPMTIAPGEVTTLSWETVNATSVDIDQGVLTGGQPTGTIMVSPTANTTYTLTAKGADGSTVTAMVTVMVQVGGPVIDSFTASPMMIFEGQTVTLNWQTTDATSVDIDQGTLTGGQPSGALMVTPTADTTYTLTARDDAGLTSTAMVNVVVMPLNGPVINSFSAAPQSITLGQSTTLSWDVLGATNISINDDQGNQVYNGADAMSSVSVTPTVDGTRTYTLLATDGAGSVTDQVSVTVNPVGGPTIISFTATPSNVDLGNPVTLAWEVVGATQVEIQEGGQTLTTSPNLTGNFTVNPTADTTYTLVASNAGVNSQAQVSVTVNLMAPPAITDFSATPNPVAQGAQTSLGWTTVGADTVRILRGMVELTSSTMNTGSFMVSPVGDMETFTLEATNTFGTSTQQVTVYAHPAPVINTFTISPQTIMGASQVTVTWDVSNVASLELLQNGVAVAGFPQVMSSPGVVNDNGTFMVNVTVTSDFTLVATSGGGNAQQTLTVTNGNQETEPNDTPQTATAHPGANAAFAGELNPSGDLDWYSIVVPQGGYIRAETSDGLGGCPMDTTLTVTSTDGVTQLAFNDDGGTDLCSLIDPFTEAAVTNLDAGTYYVLVEAFNAGTGTYVVTIDAQGPGCGNGFVEGNEQCDDGNTTTADGCDASCQVELVGAPLNPPGGTVGMTLSAPNTYQTVQIVVPTDGMTLAASAADVGGTTCDTVDTALVLTDATFTTLLGQKSGDGPIGTAGECAAIVPPTDTFAVNLAAGTYHLIVFNEGQSNGAVELDVTLSAPVCGDGIINGADQCDDGNLTAGDGCDANCQVEVAQTINLLRAPTTVPGALPIVGAQFTVGLNVTADSYVSAETFDSAAAGTCTVDTVIFLFDAQGNELLNDDEGGTNGCSRFDTLLTVGNYFVVVEDYLNDDAIPAFELVITGNQANICGNGIRETGETCDDGNLTAGDGCDAMCNYEGVLPIQEIEPNDTPATATPTGLNAPGLVSVQGQTNQGGTSGDLDYFEVTVPAGGAILSARTYTLLGDPLSCDNALTDTTITVRDSADTELAFNGDIGAEYCSEITNLVLTAGTYYVRVEGWQNTTATDYIMDINFAQANVCGNGIVEMAEQCDDGNLTAGDGCDAVCNFEGTITVESEPNDTDVTATPSLAMIGQTVTVTGIIGAVGDQDFFSFTVPAGQTATLIAQSSTARNDFTVCDEDTRIYLVDSAGVELTDDDDGGTGLCSLLDGTTNAAATNLAAGTYYLRMQHYDNSEAFATNYFMDITLQ